MVKMKKPLIDRADMRFLGRHFKEGLYIGLAVGLAIGICFYFL